jgi:hypothetical protein
MTVICIVEYLDILFEAGQGAEENIWTKDA